MRIAALLILALTAGCVGRYELRPVGEADLRPVVVDDGPPPKPAPPPTVSRNTTTINVR